MNYSYWHTPQSKARVMTTSCAKEAVMGCLTIMFHFPLFLLQLHYTMASHNEFAEEDSKSRTQD